MRAIILAAGRGSRMKSLTKDRPKCLIQLQGRALIDWQLDALREAGMREIAVVSGYKRSSLEDRDLLEFHNDRWFETNILSSLACANEWLSNGPCIVSYSDIFYESSAVKSLMEVSASIAITYDPNWIELWSKRFSNPLSDAETFSLSSSKTLTEIGSRARSIDEIEGQYMGLLFFTPRGWSEIQRIRDTLSMKDRDSMHMTGALQRVVDAGNIDVQAVPYEGLWGEIDSESDLEIYK